MKITEIQKQKPALGIPTTIRISNEDKQFIKRNHLNLSLMVRKIIELTGMIRTKGTNMAILSYAAIQQGWMCADE